MERREFLRHLFFLTATGVVACSCSEVIALYVGAERAKTLSIDIGRGPNVIDLTQSADVEALTQNFVTNPEQILTFIRLIENGTLTGYDDTQPIKIQLQNDRQRAHAIANSQVYGSSVLNIYRGRTEYSIDFESRLADERQKPGKVFLETIQTTPANLTVLVEVPFPSYQVAEFPVIAPAFPDDLQGAYGPLQLNRKIDCWGSWLNGAPNGGEVFSRLVETYLFSRERPMPQQVTNDENAVEVQNLFVVKTTKNQEYGRPEYQANMDFSFLRKGRNVPVPEATKAEFFDFVAQYYETYRPSSF